YKKWGRDKAVRQAKSKQKMLDRMLQELENMPNQYLEDQEKKIIIPRPQSTGHVVLECKDVGWNSLIKDVTFTVYSKDKVALIGPNGSGKTTLLKIIAGQVEHQGTVKIGHNVKMVYLDQFVEQLDPQNTVFDEIFEELLDQPDYVIRSYLGRFGFKGEDVFKTITDLSGGERQILALAKVLLTRPNLLLLDEPTNHMDLMTVEALEDALKEYDGNLLIVSHDVELIKNVCNRFFTIKDGSLIEVDEPLFFKVQKSQSLNKRVNSDFDEKKKLRNQVKVLKTKLQELKNLEESITYQLDEVEKQLFTTNDYDKIIKLNKQKDSLEQRLLEILEEIEDLNGKLVQLEQKQS
ncbi:MAG: ATP-binding cassette domain-containing protein, partial [Pseudothermotoga sp.]